MLSKRPAYLCFGKLDITPSKLCLHLKSLTITLKYHEIISAEYIFRSSHRSCSVEWVFLRTLKNSQENICAKVCFFLLYFFVSFFKSWLHAFNIFLFYHIDCFLNVCVSLLANAQSKQTSIGQLFLNNTSFYRHDHTTIPISSKCLHFIPPENTRKLKVSWCFQVV